MPIVDSYTHQQKAFSTIKSIIDKLKKEKIKTTVSKLKITILTQFPVPEKRIDNFLNLLIQEGSIEIKDNIIYTHCEQASQPGVCKA